MREAVIVSAVRTPVGKARGSLASVPAYQLGALVIKEAVKRAQINPNQIDEVVYANLFANETANLARVALLEAGLPITVPGITLDRQCPSALNAIAYAAILIQAGYADIVVAGGAESDSRRAYVMEKPKDAYQIMPPQWAAIHLTPVEEDNVPMGITAENVAIKYGISRQECDKFALESHRKAAKAWEAGYFDDQIVPVEVTLGKGKSLMFSKDEIFRADSSLDALAKLRPAFKKDGIVTAGNSSPMSDGAGALVLMEKNQAKAMGLEILAKFKDYAAAGVDPKIMGIGPVPATNKLMKRAKCELKDVDLIELNEAFAAQSIGCVQELDMNMDKVNVNGGAIALGHPLGGTGAIITTKLLYEMKRRDVGLGMVSFCAGGGQGVSVLFERE